MGEGTKSSKEDMFGGGLGAKKWCYAAVPGGGESAAWRIIGRLIPLVPGIREETEFHPVFSFLQLRPRCRGIMLMAS
jgi:hypothetical protein